MAEHPILSPDHDLWLAQLRVAAETGALDETTDRAIMTDGIRLSPSRQDLESLVFMYYYDSNPGYPAMVREAPEALVSDLLMKRNGFSRDPFELVMAGWIHMSMPLERRFELQHEFEANGDADFGNSETMVSLLCRAWLMSGLPEQTRIACTAELLKKLPTEGEFDDVHQATLETLSDAPEYVALTRALRAEG